uniref:Carboxylic ester hydrolase n=1 Tax=Leptobrachium leishanense TaxID=445787 RepID=A0A8C5PHG2_9ANUR
MSPPGGGSAYMGTLTRTVLLYCLVFVVHGAKDAPGYAASRPLLTTKYGQLQGKTNTVKGTDRAVHVFLGIPFAKPPIGELRFAPPQPLDPWTSIRNASEHPPMCIQSRKLLNELKEFFMGEFPPPHLSEDCLTLNIYTPADRKPSDHLPVMVFIHGGALILGGATMLDGSALSAYENVVVVSLQYRLGILGFLSTGTKEATGNYGLLDQVAALQWVQENIKHFGGDPQSVTIFGESAGAASVIAHVLSPSSKGLFHRAIAESGTILMTGMLARSPEDLTTLLKAVSVMSLCKVKNLVECLKKKTVKGLLATASVMSFNLGVLLGGMSREAAQLFLMALPDSVIPPAAIDLILDEYLGNATDPQEVRDRFLEMCADATIVIPALKTAIYYKAYGNPVYFYQYQHRPYMFKDLKPTYVKADHGDELPIMMGSPFMTSADFFKGPATEKEETLSKTMMKYWANFARTGNPNGPGLTAWPEHSEAESYLEINLEQKAAVGLAANRLEFWTEILPEKMKHMFPEPVTWQMLRKRLEKLVHTEL